MIDYDRIKEELSLDDIIKIIEHFIPDLNYEERQGYLVLPTVCHNLNQEDGSKKLYYYDNTHLFHCYTQCDESFDIYELVKKMLSLRDLPDDFTSVFNIISEYSNNFYRFAEQENSYQSTAEKYLSKSGEPVYKTYDSKVLACFQDVYPIEWINDGITIASMQKFNIKFNVPDNQIIIPHYNIDSQLIGIRVRNLDEYRIENAGKYMPAKIEGKFYTHPLMYNLYGLNFNKEAIRKSGVALIAESEKSVLIGDGWFGKNNCVVATCGNKFNKFLVRQLVKLGARDIIVCYDRMNDDKLTDQSYFNRLYSMCARYKDYANFSFIFDRDKILEYKAAPFDSGYDIFNELMQRRVYVS